MARIEECCLGSRVKLADGWGGIARIIGHRRANVVTGLLAALPHKISVETEGPDVVQIEFEQPVRSAPNHQVIGMSCRPEELVLLPRQARGGAA